MKCAPIRPSSSGFLFSERSSRGFFAAPLDLGRNRGGPPPKPEIPDVAAARGEIPGKQGVEDRDLFAFPADPKTTIINGTAESFFIKVLAGRGEVDHERTLAVEVTVIAAEAALKAEGFPFPVDEPERTEETFSFAFAVRI